MLIKWNAELAPHAKYLQQLTPFGGQEYVLVN